MMASVFFLKVRCRRNRFKINAKKIFFQQIGFHNNDEELQKCIYKTFVVVDGGEAL
jgi:hypothetical protein